MRWGFASRKKGEPEETCGLLVNRVRPRTWRGNFLLWLAVAAVGFSLFTEPLLAEQSTNQGAEYKVVAIKGVVEVARARSQTFDPARTNQVLLAGDQVRVGELSELTLRRADQSICRFSENSLFTIEAPSKPESGRSALRFLSGVLYFFHRGKPGELEVQSRSASAAVRGTEFVVSVDNADTMVVTVIDGQVVLANEAGTLPLANGQQGVAVPGQAPVLRPALELSSIIQWTLYYPGVLDVQELPWDEQERSALSESIAAYKTGNLLLALDRYPGGRVAQSAAEKVYRAALLLTVGQVTAAQGMLSAVTASAAHDENATGRLASALETLIDVVKSKRTSPITAPGLATEWLVESYREQSAAHLERALEASRKATEKSPEFGFAWERLAELEFSFGQTERSKVALTKALEASPANAQAMALNGFLYAARNAMRDAIAQFDAAIAVDPGLSTAWLGRGLCRIRTGQLEGGREDLLTAAALEPQHAYLRSYLAKAWMDGHKPELAEHELALAKTLDPADPTPWLYSALLNRESSRVNEAIRDLEHSQDLSTNRAIYRSSFLLDQDRAVRSANLAHIYRDAGMTDWGVREAGRAVSADYDNYSAHLFLANSYDELRDPRRINLRYETPAESEYLIANLLAPVGAGTLSQSISQGEYSKLFERNRLGVVSSTEYLSRGAWYENGAQFGTVGNSSYSIEGVYRQDPGERSNNDFYERELRLHFRQQLSEKDTVYLRLVQYESEGGDRFQYFDPTLPYEKGGPNLGLRTLERQEPTLTLGYHHEWAPGSDFLFVAARFADTYQESNPTAALWGRAEFFGDLQQVQNIQADLRMREESEIYSLEPQQIWRTAKHTTIFGARFQWGDSKLQSVGDTSFSPPPAQDYFPDGFPVQPDEHSSFHRWSAYVYHTWEPVDWLALSAGLVYDRLEYPENITSVPFSTTDVVVEKVLPKAGVVWTPNEATSVRAAYTKSLGGAGLDQSIRLEPTQVAGFNQAFRSVIPESLVGANPGARFETFDLSFEHRFSHGTFLTLGGQILNSDLYRTLGAFTQDFIQDIYGAPSSLHEDISYRERSLFASVDQLIGANVVLGAGYRLADARFTSHYAETPAFTSPEDAFQPDSREESTLHQVQLRAVYNHPLGFFGQVNGNWYSQNTVGKGGDDFWQLNILAGYRFWQRRAQVTLGLLNVTDQDYRLNPVVLYNELPRERTFMAKFDFNF